MKKLILALLLLLSCLFFFSCIAEDCEHKYLSSSLRVPTCDKEGYTSNVCTSCGAEFKTKYTLPTGHNIMQTVFAPTCTDVGYTYYSCECGYNYTSDYLPPAGHSYTEQIVPKKCESAGYTLYTCSACEHAYKGNFVEATGHQMSEKVYLPTEDTAGYTEHTCQNCDYIYKDDFVFFPDIYGGTKVKNTEILSKGIDVSIYQHTKTDDGYAPLDWVALKAAGVDFAILKAGSGKSGIDPVFEMNYADAKAAGIKVGAYFYSYATNEDEINAEVDLLLTLLAGKEFEYPIYFDLEDPSLTETGDKDLLTGYCMTFIDRLRENGYYGALYTNNKWITTLLHEDVLRAYCDIWYARYPSSDKITMENDYKWNNDLYGEQLGMWQYTQTGVIEGCGIPKNQTIDLNYCYKDYETIIKKYGLNGFKNDNIVVNE